MVLGQLFDRFVLIRQASTGHTLQNRVGLLRKFRLVRANGVNVVLPLFVLEFVLVVYQLVSGRNDLFLAARERLSGIVLVAATATAATLLTLAVFFSECPHVNEIDVGRNCICRIPRIDG